MVGQPVGYLACVVLPDGEVTGGPSPEFATAARGALCTACAPDGTGRARRDVQYWTPRLLSRPGGDA
ncbi:MAG: hypothetical protein CME98_25615 [Hyphomonas sp.]|nr:hypothetical protein [Hyphomonas sp.]